MSLYGGIRENGKVSVLGGDLDWFRRMQAFVTYTTQGNQVAADQGVRFSEDNLLAALAKIPTSSVIIVDPDPRNIRRAEGPEGMFYYLLVDDPKHEINAYFDHLSNTEFTEEKESIRYIILTVEIIGQTTSPSPGDLPLWVFNGGGASYQTVII